MIWLKRYLKYILLKQSHILKYKDFNHLPLIRFHSQDAYYNSRKNLLSTSPIGETYYSNDGNLESGGVSSTLLPIPPVESVPAERDLQMNYFFMCLDYKEDDKNEVYTFLYLVTIFLNNISHAENKLPTICTIHTITQFPP